MRRGGILGAGAALFATLVVAYGVFAWRETEERVLGAAEAEGRALLGAVAAGIESSLDASRAVDRLLSDRLLELAAHLDEALAARPGREEEILRDFVDAHRLRGAVLLDDDLAVRAVVASRPASPRPEGEVTFAAASVDRIEAEALARRAAAAGLATADRVVLGFGEDPFGARTEYLVAVRAPQTRGKLLLRQSTSDVEAFRREAGVDRLLREASRRADPAIAYLLLQRSDGRVLAADRTEHLERAWPPPDARATWEDRPDEPPVLDVALAGSWRGPPEGWLRVGLDATAVADVLRRSRRNLFLFTALVLATGTGGLLLLARAARRAESRESQLRRTIDEGERFASLGRLAAGVAHEVRSPLNALAMAAQRLGREAVPTTEPERRKFQSLHAAVLAAITRIDRTIEEFVGLARPVAPAERQRIDVAPFVDEVVASEGRGTAVVPPPSPVTLTGDRALLGKALANLVRNAHQAAPDGKVAVAWRRENGRVLFDVTDEGPGIAPEDRDRVFDPFHTRRTGGMGLGLTIARDAVRRHGGEIAAGEAPGGGARFTISLPAEPA